MKNFTHNKKGFARRPLAEGFSIVEMLIAVSIITVVGLALGYFARNIFVYNSFVSAGLANADAGRNILTVAAAEIRGATPADTGAYTIDTATATTFTFYSDIDNDGLKDRVRYFLSGTSFKKGVTKPSGSPLTYNSANEKLSTLIYNVTGTSIFSYYDKNYDGTTAALPSPVDVSKIRLVKLTVTIDRDPNRSPIPMTFSTQVSIRNLKDNL
ncbi:MAG: prepilin-type N-terminal cleavage/methylation domain-containing protein [bacterium]